MTGEDVTPHLRGSKDEGRNDGWNPAVTKVEDSEPGDALHGDDVGQVEKEEELVALEQVHVLSGLPQGPEVLGDLGLLSQSTRKESTAQPLQGGPIHTPKPQRSPVARHCNSCCCSVPAWTWHSLGTMCLSAASSVAKKGFHSKCCPFCVAALFKIGQRQKQPRFY